MSDKLAFIGGGNMASALAGGLLRQGCKAEDLHVADPSSDAREKWQKRFPGSRIDIDNDAAIAAARTVVLAIKPQHMPEVAAELGARMPEPPPLFISIAAGINLASLHGWLGEKNANRARHAQYARPDRLRRRRPVRRR